LVGHDRHHAQASLRELAESLRGGRFENRPNIGFADWADHWLASLERKPSTVNSYRSAVVHAKEAFGNRKARLIGPEDVDRLNLTLRERGHSASTRAKHLRVLGACLQAAVFYRYGDSNPVRGLWLSSRHFGHSTLKVTTDFYGHWERAERKLQAAKIEGAFPV
jgi:hypothetical protein